MIWEGLLWLVGVGLLLILGLSYALTIPMMRRRVPDDPDHPALHGLSCEEVCFNSRDGIKLGGWWIPASSPRGTVIMCPGQNGSMDKDLPQALPLHRAGFNVLMFDFRAHGKSEGKQVTLGLLEQNDLLGAVDYLANERGISRVGVLGFSMGAGVALLVAAQDTRMAAVVVDGAFPQMSTLLINRLRIQKIPTLPARVLGWLTLWIASLRAYRRLYRARPIAVAARISIPVLFIHGDLDPFVSVAEIEGLKARISSPSDLWRVSDVGHRQAFGKYPDEYNRRVVDWFGQHLS